MKQPSITRLYKYRACDTYSLNALKNRTGWFAKPTSFNDPFDCAISVSEERCEESVQVAIDLALKHAGKTRDDLLPEQLKVKPEDREIYLKCRQLVSDSLQDIGVFCLSEVCDDILMWSHYADKHGGFCVEYERAPENNLGYMAEPVQYQPQYPKLAFHDIAGPTPGASIDVLWLTKSDHWSYEREWRILQKPGDKEYQLDSEVTSVIFGMRMLESEKSMIRHLLRDYPRIKFKQAYKSETHFRLDIVGLADTVSERRSKKD